MSKTEIQVNIPDTISWTAYRALAARTEAPSGAIIFGCDDTAANVFVRLTHAIIGVRTELDEILELFIDTSSMDLMTFKAKLAEELGDASWYAVMLEEYLGAWLEASMLDNSEALLAIDVGLNAQTTLGRKFLDAGKRQLIYSPTAKPEKKQANGEVLIQVWADATKVLARLAQLHGLEPGRIWATNIRKLMIRYATKFDSQEAFDRDLEKEFALLHADASRAAQG